MSLFFFGVDLEFVEFKAYIMVTGVNKDKKKNYKCKFSYRALERNLAREDP